MKLSLGQPPGPRSFEYALHAEALGYDRVWVYDSPGLYWDPWTTLTQIGLGTQHIGLGVGTLIPGMRHVMTTLAAATTLESVAPGRLAIAVGTGFTGRIVLNQRPHTFSHVEQYVSALRRLFQGEEVEFEGALLRSLHSSVGVPLPAQAPPILVAANGPKGVAAAKAVGDGIMTIMGPQAGFDWSVYSICGTVLDPSETPDSPAVLERVLPGVAVLYHVTYEFGGAAVDQLPGGSEWRAYIEDIPLERRHLAVHEGHAVAVPESERKLLSPALVAQTLTGTAEEIAAKVDEFAEAGVTEVIYTPMGPNAHREIDMMASVVGLRPRR